VKATSIVCSEIFHIPGVVSFLGRDRNRNIGGFISSKYSPNPQVLITRIEADLLMKRMLQYKTKFIKVSVIYIDFTIKGNMEIKKKKVTN
jgi:hypothetical protein